MLLETNKRKISLIKYKSNSKNISIFTNDEKLSLMELYQHIKNKYEDFIRIPELMKYLKSYELMNSFVSNKILENIEEQSGNYNFDEFIEVLEKSVGKLDDEQGIRVLFDFLKEDNNSIIANKDGMRKVIDDLGIIISNDQLQNLINFITNSYNKHEGFNFEEFKDYFYKNN